MTVYKTCHCPDRSVCAHFYHYKFELDGRRYRACTKTANRRTSERVMLKDYNLALENRYEIARPKIVKLSTHIENYLEHTKPLHTTSYKNQSVLDGLSKIVGAKLLKDVGAFEIERWMTARAKVVSKSTVNRELNIVRGCFTKAVEWKLLAESPCATVEIFAVDDCRIRVLSDDELRRVLLIEDEFVSAICRTTLESLARLSEVLNIHQSHIGNGWIELRRKGGSVDRAAVTPETRERLLRRCHGTTGLVFGEGVLGRLPTQQTATGRILRALQKAGVTDASHHTMRHTGVTIMLEKGVNPRVIQKLAGWTSLRMLERYGHTRDAEAQRATRSVASYLDDIANSLQHPATETATLD